jgi:hypothetical protein
MTWWWTNRLCETNKLVSKDRYEIMYVWHYERQQCTYRKTCPNFTKGRHVNPVSTNQTHHLAIVDCISENLKEFHCWFKSSPVKLSHPFSQNLFGQLLFISTLTCYSPTQHTSTLSLTTCLTTGILVWRHVHLQFQRVFWVTNPNKINLNHRTPLVILDRCRVHVSFKPLRASSNNDSLVLFR